MTLPEQFLEKAINAEVTGPGSEAAFARRLMRNFDDLDGRTTELEGRLTNWQDWTPTWANFTTGDGTLNQASYTRAGKAILFILRFTLGGTSSVSTAPTFTLPVTASHAFVTLNARFYDSSATSYYEGRCEFASTTTAGLFALDSSGTYVTRANVTSTVPFTWATGDQILALGLYQAA